METYCSSQILQMDQSRFLFDGNRLCEDQTPDELEMQDDDVIDAVIFQKVVTVGKMEGPTCQERPTPRGCPRTLHPSGVVGDLTRSSTSERSSVMAGENEPGSSAEHIDLKVKGQVLRDDCHLKARAKAKLALHDAASAPG